MGQYAGLAVSQKLTAMCVIDQDGKQLWRGSCATSPGSIAAVCVPWTRVSTSAKDMSLERVFLTCLTYPDHPFLGHGCYHFP